MPPIRGVILDIDGTLVDSNDAHAWAWVDCLAEAGYDVPFEKIRPLIGMGGDKVLPRLIDVEDDTPEGKRLSKRRGEIFKERYLPHVRPTPGAHDLLQHIRDQGVTLAVATSAQPDEMRALLRLIGAEDLIADEHKTTSKDAEETKPDPDIMHAALARLGMGPAEAIMLGDTPYDVEAARKAGVGAIAVRSGGWDSPDLDDALAIYDDPADLLAHYAESPLGRSDPPAARPG